jgi:hypothetical protein
MLVALAQDRTTMLLATASLSSDNGDCDKPLYNGLHLRRKKGSCWHLPSSKRVASIVFTIPEALAAHMF